MSRNTDKIVVYIGASKAGKGYEKAYEILKNYGNIELISTGPNELKLPIKNFNHLEYDDYIKLLNASDIVLALSNFKEGWNRIAAEAMFLKKPVIGSLSGGLSELLIEGGQLVYKPELDNLYSQIEQAYINRESLGLSGKIFVQKFDKGYFSEAWQNLIKQNFF